MNASPPNFLQFLVGAEDGFSFKHRLFQIVSGSSAIASAFIAVVHLIIGQTFTGYSIGLLSVFLWLAFGISRGLKRNALGIALFGVSSSAILYYTYLRSGGINGESLYGILIVYLSLTLICSKAMRIPLSIIFVILLGSLLTIEQFFPGLIQSVPKGTELTAEILSFGSVFLSLTFVCYSGATFLWDEYTEKNQIANSQFNKIEKQNLIIKEKIGELEETNQQKDRLFAIIGHDLRNPLASIEGYLDALDHGLDQEDQDHIKNQLLNLVQNSRGLLDNLVKWAKKDTQAKIQSLNAKEIAIDAISTLKPIAANKGISISVLMDEDDALVLADRNMLEMVIRNLVSNAIKFTREGGWIKIRAYTHSDFIALEVEDNGVGMDENQKNRLFTPDKLIQAGTNEEKGVGLGLLLCKEFVEKMRGSISCSSIKDKGSNFKINLPIPNNNIVANKESEASFSG